MLRYQNATAVRSDLSHLRISARCGCIRLARATYVADAISHHDDDQELLMLGSVQIEGFSAPALRLCCEHGLKTNKLQRRYLNNPLLESITWLEVTVGPVSE